jgi:hypothetical protein
MLVTDSFVFVHIPKTGGSFVDSVIRDHLPVIEHDVGKHTPYGDLPARWHHLPGFYVVRNPWDWYVSWYHYRGQRARRRNRRARPARRTRNPRKEAFLEGALRSGEADFKEAVTRACTGDFEDPLAPMFSQEDIDLYSARVKTIAGPALDRSDFSALRFERLRKELLRFLRNHAHVPTTLASAIRRHPPMRASAHGPYQGYYDDDLRRLVGEKTGWLCERFGYEFGPSARVTPAGHSA